MNRAELNRLWFEALRQSTEANEPYIRYHFAALVAAQEREACAKVCEQLVSPYAESVGSLRHATLACATAIRARGQEPPR